MDVFKHYVVQDALYLSVFSRAVALVGVKAFSDDDVVTLLRNAEAALSFERKSLHEFLLTEWGIGSEQISTYEMTPVTMAYTSFLIATAYDKSFIQGLAAILPCFWVYYEVGRELVKKGSPNKTYQRWIDTYASTEYERSVKEVIDVMVRCAEKASEEDKSMAKKLFRLSSIYEYLFWEEAYRLKGWPFRL